jgi:ATP-binding cassette, subfamily B, heavy metal transporter
MNDVSFAQVAQAAFVQLSETTFAHLHTLSLDWHLQKKLGVVIRSMDRGIAACDTLMNYLFLWLVPTLAECVVVCIIFATYFSYFPLAMAVFYFVWVYIVWTILVTLWRKKFRKAVVQSDNEWHDRCTDSLINFETVKFFTAEDYEGKLFGQSVRRYQEGSVNVQASLSFLNVSQKVILQLCLATALSLAAWGIKQRIDCCLELGCESGVSECCQAISQATCPGMQVGDFVAVLTYTLQLFAPLNFLGSIYNAVVMATIDLGNLSSLLAENPDVTDARNAISLPLNKPPRKTTRIRGRDVYDIETKRVIYDVPVAETDGDSVTTGTASIGDDIAVEFDNVYFHYPSQSPSKGLKGVSFTMKRGTTTAIVGPTGAGKTTISRLFFRFYDVLGGSIKINGVDIRKVTQKSLRGAIGVVPQAASMFNDTIRYNLMYGRRTATQEQLEQAARDAQLLDFIQTLELGWETMVGDRGLKLSGGEKQRAAIARCLLKDPPFVCTYFYASDVY